MSLLQPWALLALPLVALPIVIHLVHRRRHRVVEWGAMMFLLQGSRLSRGRQRLREILLLALRTLAVLGVLVALGRPIAGGWVGELAGERLDTVVLVVDRSASMSEGVAGRAESKLAFGLRRIVRALEVARPDDLVVVDAVAPATTMRLGGAEDLGDLTVGTPTDAASDLVGAFETAAAYLAESASGRAEIWVLSDGQGADWAPDDGRWTALAERLAAAPAGVRVRLDADVSDSPSNLAVRVERARRVETNDGAELVLDVVVTRAGASRAAGDTALRVPVAIEVDGARSSVEIELVGTEARLQGHRVPIDRRRSVGFGMVELVADARPSDDRHWFVFGGTSVLETLLVMERRDVASAVAAAAATQLDPAWTSAVRALEAGAPLDVDATGASLVVWQAPLPEGAVRASLEDFVEGGGALLFLPPENPAGRTFGGLRWGAWRDRGPAFPTVWRSDDDLLRAGSDGTPLPVGEVELRRTCGIEGAEDASRSSATLASTDDGAPLLVRSTTARGGIYFFGALPSADSSNLASQGIVLVALVHRALASVAEARGSGLERDAGALGDLEARGWTPVAGSAAAAPLAERGWFAGVWSDGDRYVAANRPRSEDESPAQALAALSGLFGGVDVVATSASSGGSEGGLLEEIWRLFFVLVVAALVSEALLGWNEGEPRRSGEGGLTIDARTSAALEFQAAGPAHAWAAGLLLAAVAALGVRAWLRSGRRASILVVESLRIALVAAVLAALAGPEWVRSQAPDKDPLVAVLWDDSLSMSTRDVVLPEGPVARAEIVRRRLADVFGPTSGDGALASSTTLDGRFELVASPLSAAAEGDDAAPAGEGEAGTDLATPLARALEDPLLRAVLLLSDGDWNEGGSPYDVAVRYRLADVPIFTVCVGSRNRLPDVALEPVDPPSFAIVGRPVEIPVTIDGAMPRDVETTLVLSDDSGVLESRRITLPARRSFGETIEYRPTAPGRIRLTVEVAAVEGELDPDNNRRTFEIEARPESLRVLLVESVPRWEYRYLRNALVRDPGVDVDCLLTHPPLNGNGGGPHYLGAFPAREDLAAYDVVFVGDVGLGEEGLTVEQCGWIAGLVREQAVGLVLMPGLGAGHLELLETPLGELFPVDLDPASPRGIGSAAPSRLALTEAGRASALTRLVPDSAENARLWRELPGFQWHAATVRVRAGAQVLAVHADSETSYGRRPLLVTRTARTGKVLFMGTDAAWRWREGYEDVYHYRFWGQVIRWMAYQRNMNVGESMRLFFAPDRPRARTTIALFANVMDDAGAPLEGARVRARIQSPSGRVERLAFEPATAEGADAEHDAWGLYTASFRPTEGGQHTVEMTCEETGATLAAQIPVIARPRERLGLPARPDVMDEIARVARGRALEAFSPTVLAERLAELPEPEPLVTRLRIWSHPLLGALLVALMAGMWGARKLAGRV